MTERKKKPWFVWFSILSWLILLPWGFFSILFVEKRGIMAWCSLAIRFFLWVMAAMIPAGLASTAIDFLFPEPVADIGYVFVWIYLYFAGVYTSYKIYGMIKYKNQ